MLNAQKIAFPLPRIGLDRLLPSPMSTEASRHDAFAKTFSLLFEQVAESSPAEIPASSRT
jgi:hypothetical protein